MEYLGIKAKILNGHYNYTNFMGNVGKDFTIDAKKIYDISKTSTKNSDSSACISNLYVFEKIQNTIRGMNIKLSDMMVKAKKDSLDAFRKDITSLDLCVNNLNTKEKDTIFWKAYNLSNLIQFKDTKELEGKDNYIIRQMGILKIYFELTVMIADLHNSIKEK